MAFMIFPITGFVRLFGFFNSTVKRLTRSTIDVMFVWPKLCLNKTKSFGTGLGPMAVRPLIPSARTADGERRRPTGTGC
ncbi:hypothetical protein C8N42_11543 [Celeribacter persicus]|uniref:Uncharacterized protein n=1 Tax=Celeribacter persicus TaxID=1651082 RepID=A0A2T5H9S5_9RHOB|nr:hypothetical protein [Celeribacter persicus]PTQ68331.1 hypothetical protein C8N42_11543 [Celeribacter persicus]